MILMIRETEFVNTTCGLRISIAYKILNMIAILQITRIVFSSGIINPAIKPIEEIIPMSSMKFPLLLISTETNIATEYIIKDNTNAARCSEISFSNFSPNIRYIVFIAIRVMFNIISEGASSIIP